MDIWLPKEAVVDQLWSQYKKTPNYRKYPKAIPKHNVIVEKIEIQGLKQIITNFLTKKLERDQNYKDSLAERHVSDWLKEWKEMHETLFGNILKECGDFRKTDIYFGDPYESDLYKIHPFFDGNGRIGRVLTDQLATYFGLPPATSGYPRHDRKRQKNYHNSIRACIKDSECKTLSNWIESYVSKQLEKLA